MPKDNVSVPCSADKQPAVFVDNLSISYKVPTVAGKANQGFRGKILGWKAKHEVEAIRNVSLCVYEGESLGVLGLNGSGKSTLLRAIAGLEVPKSGNVYATSRPLLLGVSAMLEPGKSGLENVRLGLLAIGLSDKEIQELLPEIIEFVDIGDAIYLPMESYSSGMGARLRFAIATAARPDILLIDEALSTGDISFNQKSKQKMDEMRAGAATFLLVSHSATTIQKMCGRAVWLIDGKLVADGPAHEVGDAYYLWATAKAQGEFEEAEKYLSECKKAFPATSFDWGL